MVRNWFIYLAALGSAVVFYIFFYAWFSEFLLLLLLCIPLFSLALSLPFMASMRLKMQVVGPVRRGSPVQLQIRTRSRLPQLICRFTLQTTGSLSGQQKKFRIRPASLTVAQDLDTSHCGILTYSVGRVRIYDFLGLFFLPAKWNQQAQLLILPQPQPPETLPDLTQLKHFSFRPKAGGGYSEFHELRDYRPGDSLREIHWKLTAKVDRPIVREPQEPAQGSVVLTLDLAGSPEQIDSCLDQTCWLSSWLLDQGICHVVRWMSGEVPKEKLMRHPEDLCALEQSLCISSRSTGTVSAQSWAADASWHYHVQPKEGI